MRNSTLKQRKPLNKISPKTAKKNREWNRIVNELAEQLNYSCEICHEHIGFIGEFGLSGHHVIPRSNGRIDTKENCLVICYKCHNHDKYAKNKGIPITREEAQEIINKRANK